MLKNIILFLLRFYKKFISPLLPSACRFYPTCSEYFYEAVEKKGIFKGSWMGIKRLLRCHPFNPGGYDPVEPENKIMEKSWKKDSLLQ